VSNSASLDQSNTVKTAEPVPQTLNSNGKKLTGQTHQDRNVLICPAGDYKIIRNLGYGCSSKVFKVQDEAGIVFAAKCIRKDKNYEKSFARGMLLREHKLATLLQSHPNVIKSYAIFGDATFESAGKSQDCMFNLLEYCANGALSEFVRYTGGVQETIAKFFAFQLFSAVEYLHSMNFAHLDIKLENILLDEYFNLKLADFGSAIDLRLTHGLTKHKRGTRFYLPPEVDQCEALGAYNGFSADIYTLGVTLFLLLTGEFPQAGDFIDSDSTDSEEMLTLEKSKMENTDIGSIWKQLSFEVRDLISAMINPDPILRPTIAQVLSHGWFDIENWD
jgi:serine/threonine protein kinase